METETPRVVKMFQALCDDPRPKTRGKVVITVQVEDAEGETRLHRTYQLRRWTARSGDLMVSVEVKGSGDYLSGIRAICPLYLNLTTGAISENRKDTRVTPLLAYGARNALLYARTGEVDAPRNGAVRALEESVCACCGLSLTDPDSIDRGIGPECWERLTGSRPTRRSTAMSLAA